LSSQAKSVSPAATPEAAIQTIAQRKPDGMRPS
jgi:hypothetical protein